MFYNRHTKHSGEDAAMTPEEKVPAAEIDLLLKEIHRVLERNQNTRFLKKLLTRALILESLLQ